MVIAKANNLSKKFFVSYEGSNRPSFWSLLKLISGFDTKNWNSKENTFWALRDVSFELKKGDAMGIVGLNGAGKSTLLKILLNRLYPDEGSFDITGDAGGLIELGAGFHPENTGLKNIEMNAKLLGATSKEINDKLDSIIDFAEIGDFIKLPVKTYSSGMNVRLGFAIAIHFVKNLVICDEVLSVGDFEFRQKCLKKINELRKERSFILVSHSARDISVFCNKAILLHKGHLITSGTPAHVLECYSYLNHHTSVKEAKDTVEKIKAGQVTLPTKQRKAKQSASAISGPSHFDEEALDYFDVDWDIPEINKSHSIKCGSDITFLIKFKLKKNFETLRVGIPFFNEYGEMVIGPDTRLNSAELDDLKAGINYELHFVIPNFPITSGKLHCVVTLCQDPAFLYRQFFNTLDCINPNFFYGTFKTIPQIHLKSYGT